MKDSTIEHARDRMDDAREWIETAVADILREDGDTRPFALTVAQENQRLDLAPESAPLIQIPFRHRRIERSKAMGRPVSQVTFWMSGRPGEREYDRMLKDRVGVLGAHAWDRPDGKSREFEAAVVFDYRRLRALPPVRRIAMEQHGPPSPVPFVGFDVAALIAWGVVRRWTPDADYFAGMSWGARQQTPGQGSLV